MSAAPSLLYRCTVCEVDWTYEAVRHIACCRACGGSLVRSDAVAALVPVPVPVPVRVPVAARRVKRRGGRLASPLPAR